MQDMEVVINKEIMKLKFEEKDFTQLGRNKYVRWNTLPSATLHLPRIYIGFWKKGEPLDCNIPPPPSWRVWPPCRANPPLAGSTGCVPVRRRNWPLCGAWRPPQAAVPYVVA